MQRKLLSHSESVSKLISDIYAHIRSTYLHVYNIVTKNPFSIATFSELDLSVHSFKFLNMNNMQNRYVLKAVISLVISKGGKNSK